MQLLSTDGNHVYRASQYWVSKLGQSRVYQLVYIIPWFYLKMKYYCSFIWTTVQFTLLKFKSICFIDFSIRFPNCSVSVVFFFICRLIFIARLFFRFLTQFSTSRLSMLSYISVTWLKNYYWPPVNIYYRILLTSLRVLLTSSNIGI